MSLIIKNGRVICPKQSLDKITDIYIEHGKIQKIGKLESSNAEKMLDATNQWIIPGMIDSCCRPQMLHPNGATLLHEAHIALQKGFTGFCIPPDGTPILDEPAYVKGMLQPSDTTLTHLYPMGALTQALEGQYMTDYTSLIQSGCVALTNALQPIVDLRILRHAYDYAASFDILLVIQPQDPWLAKNGVAHEGINSTHLGLPGIPEIAETVAIAQHLLLIEQTGARAHFTCLTSQGGVELIRQAKAKGLSISADTAMHSLHLNEMDIGIFNANCHLIPPLRSENDRLALLKGLNDGTIDAICSDHRPLDSTEKLAPFGETTPGMSSIDTFLSLGLKLIQSNQLNLSTFVRATSFNPSKIFKLPESCIQEGVAADLCIIDPNATWQVSDSTLLSQGKNNAFKECILSGEVRATFLNGTLVHE